MSLEKNIQDTLRLQDIELANAMTALRNNPAQLSQFIAKQCVALISSRPLIDFKLALGNLTIICRSIGGGTGV